MSYLVLARKWRPQTFSDLIGQEHVSQTLKNAIDSGRVAHAFLFTGARGVGKTSSARILAKALNCEQGLTTEPCNACDACREITDGNSVDVFEIDGASNTGVDDIRDLRDNVKYLPAHSRYKIFIIDEVHMLSTSAFNALLKTLEEPPAHVKFIFATTEPHKVPITILSRCQRFDFKRIPLAMIVARLRYIVDQEQVAITDKALAMIARKGDGSMRDSLSALDQVLAFCGESVDDDDVADILGVVDRQLVLAAVRAVFARDTATLLAIVARADDSGCNLRSFGNELIDTMRALLLLKSTPASSDLLDLADAELAECRMMAEGSDITTLQRHLTILLRADGDMAHSSYSRLLLEMALIKMATLAPALPVNELLERLKALEALKASGPAAMLASDPATMPYRSAPARPQPATASQPAPAAPQSAPPTASSCSTPDWPGFVAFVKASKPMLATKLEKGSPLETADGLLRIGYPQGTIELSMLQETDSLQHLAELAAAYYGRPVSVKIVPLSGSEQSLPQSLDEKKSDEIARNDLAMKDAANRHPLVRAAIETFGGEIVAYRQPIKT